jgi:hypothetical protein
MALAAMPVISRYILGYVKMVLFQTAAYVAMVLTELVSYKRIGV